MNACTSFKLNYLQLNIKLDDFNQNRSNGSDMQMNKEAINLLQVTNKALAFSIG